MASLSHNELIYWSLLTLFGSIDKGQHWWMEWLIACSLPSHYLNQCWLIFCYTLRNKLQWNLTQDTNMFIKVNSFENFVYKKCSIFFLSSVCCHMYMYFRTPCICGADSVAKPSAEHVTSAGERGRVRGGAGEYGALYGVHATTQYTGDTLHTRSHWCESGTINSWVFDRNFDLWRRAKSSFGPMCKYFIEKSAIPVILYLEYMWWSSELCYLLSSILFIHSL